MSILSRIRSWFGRVSGSLNTLSISETSPQIAMRETEEQDQKAEKLIEAMKVAHEEQPQSDLVKPLAIQPEDVASQNIPNNQSDSIQTLAVQPENVQPQNIQPIQKEDIQQSQNIPTQPENIPSQNIQSIQPELKVKRSRKPRSNSPRRSRSRKRSKENANPET
ncbi:MAG: hypothetical protein ACUVTD_01640 [Nitrososphaerales archaeon]